MFMSDSSLQPFCASDLGLADNANIAICQVYISEVQWKKQLNTPNTFESCQSKD